MVPSAPSFSILLTTAPYFPVLLYCYHYDPRTGKYGAVVSNMLKLGALGTMLILGTFMFVMFRADHRSARPAAHGESGRVK